MAGLLVLNFFPRRSTHFTRACMATPPLKTSTPTVRVQLASDLHLEHFAKLPSASTFVIPPKEEAITDTPSTLPYLILAGDIVSVAAQRYLQPFLTELRPHYREVFMVAGNHEFYAGSSHTGPSRSSRSEIVLALSDLCDAAGVRFLDRTRFENDEIVVLGATLWSYVPDGYHERIRRSISDYSQIRGPEMSPGVRRNITPADTNSWHDQDREWLTSELLKQHLSKPAGADSTSAPEKKLIVVTHHLPSFGCVVPAYQGSDINYAFASDLDGLIKNFQPDLWCFGHTHSSVDLQMGPFGDQKQSRETVSGKSRVVANPRGYPGRGGRPSENRDYDPTKIFLI